MATENYDPDFEGDELQPGTNSPEAEQFRRLAFSILTDPNSVTLVKADWRDREVVVLFRIEAEGDGGTDGEPVAVMMSDWLFEEITPREGAVI